MNPLLNSLTEAELLLVRETDRDRIAAMDEDTLVELHVRIRRARDKYVKLYRREASSKVAEYGARGKARPKNTRNLGKAEVFEDALSRVSRQLATAARASATALKAERLEMARQARNMAPPAPPKKTTNRAPAAARRPASKPESASLRRRQASTLAKGARRQAKRDAT
jgi:hypothetical protein